MRIGRACGIIAYQIEDCVGGKNKWEQRIYYWPIYKNLEKELLDLSYSIHFCDGQLEVFSAQIAELLIRCSVEIESLIKDLYRQEKKTEPKNVGKALLSLNNDWCLDKKVVIVSAPSMYFSSDENKAFAPLGYKPTTKEEEADENDYYRAYCAVKHDRVKNIKKANQRVLLRAIASLYLLNVYYRNEVFDVGTVSTKVPFDTALQSDVFAVKYAVLNNSRYSGDELAKIPDVTYVGILTAEGQQKAQKSMVAFNQKIVERAVTQIRKDPESAIEKIKNGASGQDLVTSVLTDPNVNVASLAGASLKDYLGAKCEAVLNKGQNMLQAQTTADEATRGDDTKPSHFNTKKSS